METQENYRKFLLNLLTVMSRWHFGQIWNDTADILFAVCKYRKSTTPSISSDVYIYKMLKFCVNILKISYFLNPSIHFVYIKWGEILVQFYSVPSLSQPWPRGLCHGLSWNFMLRFCILVHLIQDHTYTCPRCRRQGHRLRIYILKFCAKFLRYHIFWIFWID